MRKLLYSLCFLTTTLVFHFAVWSQERPDPLVANGRAETEIPIDIYRDKLRQIENTRNSGTLDDLLAQADQLVDQWESTGGDRYGRLWVELLGCLSTSRMSEQNADAPLRGQDYAVIGLRKADSFSVETEWSLLRWLRYPLKASDLENPSVLPETGTRFWLHLVHRIEKAKEPDFNPDDAGVLNVVPPNGSGDSGVDPAAIKDPKLRAEYEQAIARNNAKIRYYNEQSGLRRDEPYILRDATKYIVLTYSLAPDKVADLQKLLNDYQISETVRKSIVSRLKAAASEKR